MNNRSLSAVTLTSEQIDAFIEIFDVWEEARPYLQFIVRPEEMRLVLLMQGRTLTVSEAASVLWVEADVAQGLLDSAYRRAILNREVDGDEVRYSPADFYARLDCFIKFENWDDIPPSGRRAIDRRYLEEFILRHRENVEKMMRGEEVEHRVPNDAVILLHEAEEMVEAATDIVVLPCDCRRAGQCCDRPVDVCIWMDRMAREALDRGHGRRISIEQAIDILRQADKKGLMHTSDIHWRERGLSAICNCCACDCYPFRAGVRLGSKGTWPQERYVAVHMLDSCTKCGACVRRCHFGAFFFTDDMVEVEGRQRRDVSLAAKKCWGCGLCANACPVEAIVMQPLSTTAAGKTVGD